MLPKPPELRDALKPYGHVDTISGWVTLQRESDDRIFVFDSKTRSCSWDAVPYIIQLSWCAFLGELQGLRDANPEHDLTGVCSCSLKST